MCQQINKDLQYNNFTHSLKFTNSQLTVSITRNPASAKSNISADDFMNLDITQQYISVRSDKQKNQFTKDLCFDFDKKKHFHKNCSTNSFCKI